MQLSDKSTWETYNSLRKIEDVFRFMKSTLGMRPVYHQKEQRVDGHLWITVLAYYLIQSCLYRLKEGGLSHHWEWVRNQLSGRVRVTLQAQEKNGNIFYCRSTTSAQPHQKKIYQALELSPQISKTKRTVPSSSHL